MPETATLFIDGQWVAASNGATRTIICPADGSEVGVVSEGTSTTPTVQLRLPAQPSTRVNGVTRPLRNAVIS